MLQLAAELGVDFSDRRAAPAINDYLARLAGLPATGAPAFAAHMTQPPHPAAVFGYLAAMLRNPNNHDRRYAAATLAMEQEVIAALARMLGLPATAGEHLCSGGSVANLDGIWHCRQARPGAALAIGADAHFCHRRIARLMGVETITIPGDGDGRIELAWLEAELRRGRIGSVVLSAGTPGLGAVDPIADVVELRRRHDFRIHVDASYGGFFALLAGDPEAGLPVADFAAIAACDSVAIDPHKHGLQPYGCGCVLFAAGAGRGYDADSAYTDAAASGFECSRPGAAAGALWLTLRLLPLATASGFGPQLRACLAAARRLAGLFEQGEHLALYRRPQLGIVGAVPRRTGAAAIGAASRHIRDAAAAEGISVGTLRLPDGSEILRLVLMQPAQLDYAPTLHATLERIAGGNRACQLQ